MSFTKFYLIPSFSTTADFRTFIQSIVTGLTNAGAVQTADTGQINPATVNYPGTNSTAAGYMIFRFNDALQATKPIFIKLIFGRGTSVSAPSTTVQVSTGSDGAGNLTGLVSTAFVSAVGSAQTTDRYPSMVAGDVGASGKGWLTIGINIGHATNSYSWAFSISRTRDVNGDPTADGANYYWLYGSSSSTKQRYMDFINNNHIPAAGDMNYTTAVFPPNTPVTTFVYNGETPNFPVQPSRPYLDFPDLGGVLYSTIDIGLGQIFSTEISGAVRKYWAMGNTLIPSSTGNNTIGFAIRVE